MKSALLRKRTTSSSLVRDIDLGHQTGKSGLSADGLRLSLTLVSPMRSVVSHTGPSRTIRPFPMHAIKAPHHPWTSVNPKMLRELESHLRFSKQLVSYDFYKMYLPCNFKNYLVEYGINKLLLTSGTRTWPVNCNKGRFKGQYWLV